MYKNDVLIQKLKDKGIQCTSGKNDLVIKQKSTSVLSSVQCDDFFTTTLDSKDNICMERKLCYSYNNTSITIIEQCSTKLSSNSIKDFIITIIKYKNGSEKYKISNIYIRYGKKHYYNITKKSDITSNNQQEIQNIVNSVLKEIGKSNDYGLEGSFIYLAILVNIPIKNIDKLDIKQFNNYEECAKNCIKLTPVAEGGHIILKIENQGKEFILDSQNNSQELNIESPNSGFSFQTDIGGGCCGYFVIGYAMEILNDIDGYTVLFSHNFKNNDDAMLYLNLDTMIRVSSFIDSELFIFKSEKEVEPDAIQLLCRNKNEKNIYYFITNDCSNCNCVNIECLINYIDSLKYTRLAENTKICEKIAEQKARTTPYKPEANKENTKNNKSKKNGLPQLEQSKETSEEHDVNIEELNKHTEEQKLEQDSKQQIQNVSQIETPKQDTAKLTQSTTQQNSNTLQENSNSKQTTQITEQAITDFSQKENSVEQLSINDSSF